MQVLSRKAGFIEYWALHMSTRLVRTICVSRCSRPIVEMSSPLCPFGSPREDALALISPTKFCELRDALLIVTYPSASHNGCGGRID